jgi:hypothetical protein
MKALVRWLIFLLFGYPFQLLVMALYPLVHLYWRLFVFQYVANKPDPVHADIPVALGLATRNDGIFLNNDDNHGAFTMYNFIQESGYQKLFDSNGNFLRRYNEDNTENLDFVSGDVVSAFGFANQFYKADDDIIRKAIKNYLKNLGTCSTTDSNNGWVSTRCNNFGVNYCPDSDAYGIGQPMAGPQFYTTSALLALGYHLGWQYKALFWAHWLLLGGWYWAFSPVLYTKDNGLWYVRDITMKNLYTHAQVFGPKWWIVRPMKFINEKISTHHNQLFDAMFGKTPQNLPQCMHAFFSQNEDASSTGIGDGRVSAYIPDAMRRMAQETKLK